MTHSTYAEREYFGETRRHRDLIDWEQNERNRAQDRADLEAEALEFYRARFMATPGDMDERHNAAAVALIEAYPHDWSDLHEHAWPIVEAEWLARSAV